MFKGLRLAGERGTLMWGGYREAATFKTWRIVVVQNQEKDRTQKAWTLVGTLDRFDAFFSRQRPLFFTAPRDKGRWCFEVKEIVQAGPNTFRATIGPPLQ